MTKYILRAFLLIAAVGGLSRCGGDGGQPLQGTAVGVVIGQLNTALNQLPQSNSAPTLPMSGATVASTHGGGVSALAATTCETTSPNPTQDTDGDGIANIKVSTFDCTDFTSGGNRYTRKGSYTVTDKDNSKIGYFGGVRVDFEVGSYNYVQISDGSEYTNSYSGYWDFSTSGGSFVSTSDFTGRAANVPADPTYSYDYTYHYTWDWMQTPDTFTVPFSSGKLEFEGTYVWTGKFVEGDHGKPTVTEGTFSLKYYSKDLKYQSGCAKWYKSGSIFVDDQNGNTMEIRYACSSGQLYINGAESDLWTP